MKATFGGGCFWCTEIIFLNTEGVNSVLPGYMGGKEKIPRMNKFVLELQDM